METYEGGGNSTLGGPVAWPLAARAQAYRSNCNVTLTAMHRLKPSRNPNSHEGSIT